MSVLTFELPDGSTRDVDVVHVLNAGYAGRSQDDVAAHVAELAELGVPAPSVTPALYPVSPYLAQQTDRVAAQHARTSGEAEWALVVADDGELLLTAACDHTDRDLEVHGVAWSKNAGPDVLARRAWRLTDVEPRIDELTLRAWVTHDGRETEIQRGTLAELLTPRYWADVLSARGDLAPGTVLISGTIPMAADVDQFADGWRVELGDPATGDTIELAYAVVPMPEPIG
jgi:2-keto-4-pentenoate hydratase/2-oxohepta-3-ene-1,7-dioic acid hydratase in catechol pathway